MKKIGLIGGMSWESSLEYYKIIIPVFDTTTIHDVSAVEFALDKFCCK